MIKYHTMYVYKVLLKITTKKKKVEEECLIQVLERKVYLIQVKGQVCSSTD